MIRFHFFVHRHVLPYNLKLSTWNVQHPTSFRQQLFTLPTEMKKAAKLLALLVAGLGGTLGLHTVGLHLFAEYKSPTPDTFNWRTRVHLRRAFLFEKYQNDLDLSLKYVKMALQTEAAAVDANWCLWRKEHLAIHLRLAHSHLLNGNIQEATKVMQTVSDELHRKLLSEKTHAVLSDYPFSSIQKLAQVLIAIDSKLQNIYVLMHQYQNAISLAEASADLASSLIGTSHIPIMAGALLAKADSIKALAFIDPNRRNEAIAEYQAIIDKVGVAPNPSLKPSKQLGPFLEEAVPKIPSVECIVATCNYHIGDLLAMQQRDKKQQPAKWYQFRPFEWFHSSSTPIPTTSDILSWFMLALSKSEGRDDRPCLECQCATLTAIGAIFAKEGNKLQASHYFRLGLKASKRIGDVASENMCVSGLRQLGEIEPSP